MKPHIARIIEELEGLEVKRHDLSHFWKAPAYQRLTRIDRELLVQQFQAMTDYADTLKLRIARAQPLAKAGRPAARKAKA